jgi:hypothetical protein
MKTFGPLYTKLPPKDLIPENEIQQNNWIVSDKDLEPEKALQLMVKKTSYEGTKNPIYAIEAILLALEAGINPPMWTLDFLQDGFRKYHKRQGKRSLDDILKLGPKLFKIFAFEKRNEALCVVIFKLQVLFDLSVEKAVEAVHLKYEEEFRNESGFEMETISAYTLEEIYRKKYKKLFSPLKELFQKTPKNIQEEFRKAYLSQK